VLEEDGSREGDAVVVLKDLQATDTGTNVLLLLHRLGPRFAEHKLALAPHATIKKLLLTPMSNTTFTTNPATSNSNLTSRRS
jgi:hypothetical protein